MDFKFTEEQLMIRDTAAQFLAGACTPDAVRAAMRTQQGYDPALWQRICNDMFWQAITVPEQYGGMGLGYVELAAVLEQMGETLACAPLYASVALAVNTIRLAGNEAQQAEWLGRVVAGNTATLGFCGAVANWDAESVALTCQRNGDGFVLNGICRFVPDGHSADFVCVAARAPGSAGSTGVSLFVLPGDVDGLQRRFLPTLDQTRKQAQLQFENVRVRSEALLGEEGEAATTLAAVLDLARIAIAADQVGGAQRALDISVDYVQERVQFGRKIASYQAIKHKCADMMLKVEAARSALYYAACVADEFFAGRVNALSLCEAASIAKGYASDAYFFNAGCGIQLHGGVGFTEEYDIQLYFKRAKSTETFLGGADYHRARIAHLLFDDNTAPAAKEMPRPAGYTGAVP